MHVAGPADEADRQTKLQMIGKPVAPRGAGLFHSIDPAMSRSLARSAEIG
jgi:hypothetical protein